MKKFFPSATMLCMLLCFTAPLAISCNTNADPHTQYSVPDTSSQPVPASIGEISLPEGFHRVKVKDNSFASWLRKIKLRTDNTVRYYNGSKKPDQTLHYAVLDITTGKKDLQQCADAIMRLRAEYFFSLKQYKQVNFAYSKTLNMNFDDYANGTRYLPKGNTLIKSQKQISSPCYTHDCLMQFMETVFMYCGTYTVDGMTHVVNMSDMQPGDVYAKGGAPGHAMQIVDMAENPATGKKIYLLMQSYMPAQDMHIVINPNDQKLSPWYEVNTSDNVVVTPEWTFKSSQLKRF